MLADLNTLAESCHVNAKGKGFWDDILLIRSLLTSGVIDNEKYEVLYTRLLAARMALIGSEVGEAVESIRTGDFDNEAEELADIVIRVMDYAAGRGVKIGDQIHAKMEKNTARPHMHGKRL